MDAKKEFKLAYRAVRTLEGIDGVSGLMICKAAESRFKSVRKFGLQASKGAEDFRLAVSLNLRAVKYRAKFGRFDPAARNFPRGKM